MIILVANYTTKHNDTTTSQPLDKVFKPGFTNLLRIINKRQNCRMIRNNIILILSIDQSEIGKDKYLRCGIGSIDDKSRLGKLT